jgi:hypothetical protein
MSFVGELNINFCLYIIHFLALLLGVHITIVEIHANEHATCVHFFPFCGFNSQEN